MYNKNGTRLIQTIVPTENPLKFYRNKFLCTSISRIYYNGQTIKLLDMHYYVSYITYILNTIKNEKFYFD